MGKNTGFLEFDRAANAALPPQDPFLAAGVPASGPMAALAASIRATQRQLEQEIARIRKRFAAISPEADEDETRAIFGRASIDEALPQSAENAEEEEAREIVLDAIDDEMNDTAVLDDLFEDAPARDGADVSSEEETAEEAAEDEATDADDAFGELFADDAGDEFVAAAEDPAVKEDSNDSDDDEFPSIDDAAFEAVFGQKKTDAEEVPDEAADDVFETESEDALVEDSDETDNIETGFVLVNHTQAAEDAFAQGSNNAIDEEPAETDETETGFVLVNHAQIAEDAFAQGLDGAVDEEPAETDEAETGFVLVNHAEIAENAFAQGSDGAVDEEAAVPEANEAEFGWNDAVETDEDIFGQDADRAFGLGSAAPKDRLGSSIAACAFSQTEARSRVCRSASIAEGSVFASASAWRIIGGNSAYKNSAAIPSAISTAASAATDGRSRFSNARASGSSKKASAHAPKRMPSVGIRISRNAIAARSAAPIGISRRSDRFQPGIAVESCMKRPSLSMKWARLREKSSRKRAGWGSAFPVRERAPGQIPSLPVRFSAFAESHSPVLRTWRFIRFAVCQFKIP